MPCSRDQHDQGRRCLQVDMASKAQSRTGSVIRRPEPTPIGESHPAFVSDGLYCGPAGSATASRHAGFFLYAFDLQQGARITAINSSSSARRTGDCDHFGRCLRKLKVASRTDPEERKIYTRRGLGAADAMWGLVWVLHRCQLLPQRSSRRPSDHRRRRPTVFAAVVATSRSRLITGSPTTWPC